MAATVSRMSEQTVLDVLLARNAELESRLEDVLSAVEDHLNDVSDDANAQLYRRVFGTPQGDFRVDDPNDWPDA